MGTTIYKKESSLLGVMTALAKRVLQLLGIFLLLITTKLAAQNPQGIVLDNGAIESAVVGVINGTGTPVKPGVKAWQTGVFLENNVLCPFGVTCTYKNVISFFVNEEASPVVVGDFVASVDLKIEYRTNSSAPLSVLFKTMSLDYKKGEGLLSDKRQYIYFDQMQYVKVTVESFSFPAAISGLDFRDILTLENETDAALLYQQISNLPFSWISPPTTLAAGLDKLTVNWQLPMSPGNNAIQLEWAWLEDEVESRYFVGGAFTNASKQKLLEQGATRVELGHSVTAYSIPMLYDGQGKLHYRVRGVSKKASGTRIFGPWSTINSVSFGGHNNKLNWQATSSFAEEGKSKTVINYFDGSLRQRQTVTKDNVTGNIISSETLYDHEGRPAIQILPAVGMTSVIGYQANLNKFNRPESTLNPQNNGENHADFFDFKFAGSGTPSLQTTPGSAATYYSPSNPDLTGANKFIPDAEGYPYSVTRYTPDGTGRVQSQSGVGAAHKMGSGKETKYYYGTPTQEELDALFGTEVGYKSHYFKNMVQDANGQMSVSYVDMKGRTIATALAGNNPANLSPLSTHNNTFYPNQFREASLTVNLLDSNANLVKDNRIEAINSLLVPYTTNYTFTYTLTPESLTLPTCEPSQPVCYECLYDLEFVVTDESGEATQPVIYKKFSNLSVDMDTSCSTGTRLFQDSANLGNRYSSITFTQTLGAGSYSIRKTLTLSESSVAKLKENYLPKALCTSEFTTILDSVYTELKAVTACDIPAPVVDPASCTSCLDSLGTLANFKTKYLASIGHQGAAPTALVLEMEAAYLSGQKNCQLLCGTAVLETASKRDMMLADMMPFSGQYARNDLFAGVGGKYNIFISASYPNQPYYKNPSGFYLNDYNSKDETIHSSPAILPQLTAEEFNALFKPKWAEALLPYHPEYQRLLFAESTLKPSYNWINTFNNVTSYPAAVTAGYIFKSSADIVAGDPFFGLAATAPTQRDKMTTWLTNEYRDGLSLWQYAYYSAVCPTARTTAPCNNPSSIPKFPPYAITDAFKDSVWNRFKGLYLQARTSLINNFIATQKPLPGSEEQQLIADGFILHFPRDVDQQIQQSANQSSTPDDFSFWPAPNTPGGMPNLPPDWNTPAGEASAYQVKCESYIKQWKVALLQCPAIANHASVNTILENITSGMVAVCTKGSDEANALGASNVAPGYPVDGQPRSFEEVINAVLTTYGISRTDLCNPFIIEFPKAYGTGRPLTASVVTTVDSCNCERFAQVKAEAVTAGKDPGNLTQLNEYLQSAYGETLTPALFEGLNRCNELLVPAYITCDTLRTIYSLPCDITYDPCTEAPTPPDEPQGRMLSMENGEVVAKPMVSAMQLECPPQYRWNEWTMSCEYVGDEEPWMCIDPWVYNPFTGMCELPEEPPVCDPGLVYSDIWGMCVGPNNCPPGYEWDAVLGDCTPIAVPACEYECITGYDCDTVYLKVVALASPSVLPDFMKCGYTTVKRCLTCTDIKAKIEEFKTAFPAPYNAAPYAGVTNLDGTQLAYYQNMARFINYRTGFSFNWATYMQALESTACNLGTGGTQTVICGKSTPLSDTTGVFAKDKPCQQTYDKARHIAEKIYKARYDRVLADFESAYRNKCLAAKKQEIFTVTYTPREYHYTLYYYDQAGSLVKTIPPAGVTPNYDATYLASVKTNRRNKIAAPITHGKATEYRYNSLGQVVEQSSPDGGKSKFWYDKLGRLAVSQNSEQVKTNRYSYTIYDELGRITEVGQKVQATAMNQATSQNPTALSNWINGTGNREQITQTVYDMAYNPITPDPAVGAAIYQRNLRNRVSYTLVKNLSTDAWQANATFYTYDAHGNVNKLLQDYRGLNSSHNVSRFKHITYKYDLVSGKVNEVAYQDKEADAFYHRYNYDAKNRITEVLTSRDRVYWEKDAAYEYYKHGPLARTILGQQQVQGVDYAYTIQGWLKGVNSSNLDPVKDVGADGTGTSVVARDIFGFALHYFDNGSSERDYKPIGTTESFARPGNPLFKSLYNGNIGSMTVNNGGLQKGAIGTTNALPLMYNYNYDQLNRIVSMQAFKGLNITTNTWTPEAINDYKEQISYDPDGNIQGYTRNGAPSISGKPLAMDNLQYKYEAGKNRLSHVLDDVPVANYTEDINGQSTGNYGYDAIGNLIKDVSEGITNITWTVYGKIASITKSGNTISYTYDASGNRITKTAAGVTTLYVRDASGNVMSLYEIPAVSTITQKELHLYGSSRVGMALTESRPVGSGIGLDGGVKAFTRTLVRGEKLFELSNHLGNVLVTVSDKKIQIPKASPNEHQIDYYTADVVTATDYAPFGMQLFGRTYSASSSKYRYGFNGKENDNEVKGEGNQQDYGMRIYDNRLGRFLSVDPIRKDYPSLTPYQFAGNSPIKCTDLDGLESNPVEGFRIWLEDTWDDLTSAKRWSQAFDNVNDNFNPIYIFSNHGYKIATGEDLRGNTIDSRGRMGAVNDAIGDGLLYYFGGKLFKTAAGYGTNALEAELNASKNLLAESKPPANKPVLEVKASSQGENLKTPGGSTIRNSKYAGGLNKVAERKGYNVQVKVNGYPNYSNYLYEGGQNRVLIKMTGSYSDDFAAANTKAGYFEQNFASQSGSIPKTPDGYVWHHTENLFKAKDGQIYGWVELVENGAHNAARHSGGVQKYKEITGNKKAYK